jgi:hypothetical protein
VCGYGVEILLRLMFILFPAVTFKCGVATKGLGSGVYALCVDSSFTSETDLRYGSEKCVGNL